MAQYLFAESPGVAFYRRRSNHESRALTNDLLQWSETQLNGSWLGGYKQHGGSADILVCHSCLAAKRYAGAIRLEKA